MDLYSQKEKSIAQKITIIIIELFLLIISFRILFRSEDSFIVSWIGMEDVKGLIERSVIIFAFSVVVFVRMGFMMLYLMKRKIPWEEAFSVPFAFALYYIGFALLVLPTDIALDFFDFFAIALFLFGSFLNTYSEVQRYFWKKKTSNKGKLYTKGLFRYSVHINFFGDLLWVSAYAIITRNYYSIAIPIFLFSLFAFYNIPKLDQYLQSKYGRQFDIYKKHTKKFIPFVY